MSFDVFQILLWCVAVHVIYRQQQGAQRLQTVEQLIGDYFHIGADLAQQFQERQAVETANGVVGYDHHFARHRNALFFPSLYAVVKVKILQCLVDKVDADQMRIVTFKLLELPLVKKVAEQRHQSASNVGVLLGYCRKPLIDDRINTNHDITYPALRSGITSAS